MIGTSSSGITAPMNINAVIAHLVEMTPPQRKQFAQMHMDDPMMLSAAKFVDNQISKQAAAMSAQQTGAAPPPVNQQVVAQMSPQPPAPQAAPMPQAAPQQQAAPQDQGQAQPMPEDTGIAQLPAPNMEGMADGGIVGYVEGGTVNALGVEIDPNTGYPAVPPYKQALQAFSDWRERTDNPVRLDNSGPHPRNMPSKTAAPTAPAATRNDRTKRDPTNYAPAKAAVDKPSGIDQLRADRVESAPPSTAQATVTAAGEDYDAMYAKALKAQPDPRANIPQEIGEIQDLNTAQRTKAMALADKQEAGLKALMAERKERLAGREGRAKEQEELNPNMSLITAGLAMMQSTGKGLSGIAEGATKGVAQYMEGVKYNSAQRQKLEDARDALADLQFNQETMTDKERLAAENAYTQGSITAKNAVISTIQQREGVNRQTAAHLFDAGARQNLEGQRQQFEMGMQGQREKSQERLTKMQMDNALKAAGISAGAGVRAETDFYERLGRAAPDSALRMGFDLKQQGAKEAHLYEVYTAQKTNPVTGPDFVKDYPTFAAFMADKNKTSSGGTMPNPNWKNYNVR